MTFYKLPIGIRRRAVYIRNHRRVPNFRNPVTFSEKVNWRVLNDRRPLLEWTCDKLAMKERAREVPGLHVPRTFWTGTDVRQLASAELPEDWVLKPNHRTGCVYFGHGRPDIEVIESVTAGWLRNAEYEDKGEWAYSKARPVLLAEEFIGTPGVPPSDYKFLVFDGDIAVVQVDSGRHTVHRSSLYGPDWSALKVRCGGFKLEPPEPPPARLDRMLAIARELASGFDFIRVDLYQVGGTVFFGEFTPYPGSGFVRLVPASFDAELGARWKIPELSMQ
jgi:hypothetical protein